MYIKEGFRLLISLVKIGERAEKKCGEGGWRRNRKKGKKEKCTSQVFKTNGYCWSNEIWNIKHPAWLDKMYAQHVLHWKSCQPTIQSANCTNHPGNRWKLVCFTWNIVIYQDNNLVSYGFQTKVVLLRVLCTNHYATVPWT